MTSVFPAIVGAIVGAGLYVAFDFYVLGAQKRRRSPAPVRPARRQRLPPDGFDDAGSVERLAPSDRRTTA